MGKLRPREGKCPEFLKESRWSQHLEPRLLVWRPLNPATTPPGGTVGHSNPWPSTHTHSHTQPAVCPQVPTLGCDPGRRGWWSWQDRDRRQGISLFSFRKPNSLGSPGHLFSPPYHPPAPSHCVSSPCLPLIYWLSPWHPMELLEYQPLRFCSPPGVDQGSGNLHLSLQPSQLAAVSR